MKRSIAASNTTMCVEIFTELGKISYTHLNSKNQFRKYIWIKNFDFL